MLTFSFHFCPPHRVLLPLTFRGEWNVFSDVTLKCKVYWLTRLNDRNTNNKCILTLSKDK